MTKIGFKPVMATGMAFVAGGLAWFSQISVDGSYVGDVLFPSLLAAVGLGFSFVPVTIAAMSNVKDREAGLASGLINTSQQVGGALGLAILSSDRLLHDRRSCRAGPDRSGRSDRGLRGRVHGRRRDRPPGRHRVAHPDPGQRLEGAHRDRRRRSAGRGARAGVGLPRPLAKAATNKNSTPRFPSDETLREVVFTLAAMDRPPCSPGEREAAEWLAERFRSIGLEDVALEDEPSWGTFPPTVTTLAALGAASAALTLLGTASWARPAPLKAGLGLFDEVLNGPRVFRRAMRERENDRERAWRRRATRKRPTPSSSSPTTTRRRPASSSTRRPFAPSTSASRP